LQLKGSKEQAVVPLIEVLLEGLKICRVINRPFKVDRESG
jgi:hypothetical protein